MRDKRCLVMEDKPAWPFGSAAPKRIPVGNSGVGVYVYHSIFRLYTVINLVNCYRYVNTGCYILELNLAQN